MKDTRIWALPHKASSFGLVLSLAVSVAAILAGPTTAAAFYHGSSGQGAQQGPQVAAEDGVRVIELNDKLRFVPAEIRIKVGDTVEWRNVQSIPHTVTADPKRAKKSRNVELPGGAEPLDSGWVRGGQSFRYTFRKPGVYRYVCLPHERAGMLGTVIVG